MTPEDHSGGRIQCEQLGPFVDGELGAVEAAAFRRHLVQCARCQQEMHGLMQLSALAEQAREEGPVRKPELAPVWIAAADRRARPRRAAWVGVVGAAAMAAALVLAITHRPAGGRPELATVVAVLQTRSVAGWPSEIGPAGHRAYATTRGTTGPWTNGLARAELQFEANQSWRELATLSLLRRDFQRAEGFLQHLPDSPGVLSDRGLILLEQSRCEEALEYFDRSLHADPGFLPAQFNRGVCLRTLSLPHAAVQAFAAVAKANAGGWSTEAGTDQRATEESIARQERERAPLLEASRRLLTEGQAPGPDVLQRFPSSLRSAFYHALAGAPARQEIERLRPAAEQMDALAQGDALGKRLSRALREASPARAAVAARYSELRRAAETGQAPGAEQVQELLAAARRARQSDILLQTYESFAPTDTGPERTRLVEETHDPWFRLKLVYARAHRETGAGHLAESERLLRSARQGCTSEVLVLPCYWTRLELFEVYSQQGRMAEALREARITAVEVRREGLTDYERKALLKAAEVQTSSGQVAAARALFEELMARQPDRCTAAVYMKESLAEAYVERGDAAGATEALASAPSCDFAQDPWRVALRLRLSVLQGDREGLARSQRLADQLALNPGLRPREVEEAKLLSAMAAVELDTTGAPARLESLLANGGAEGRELRSRQADGWVSLVFEALRREDGPHAFRALAAMLGVHEPARCALGLAEDVGRSGWIARDAEGKTRSGWTRRSGAPGSTVISDEMTGALRACPEVDVLATGSVQGTASLLPDDVAWRYRIAPAEGLLRSSSTRRLLVRGATPPADLKLPPLGTAGPRVGDDWMVVEGADATPDRVLQELRTAGVVDLEVHGWVDPLVPDGAALALSEDRNGRYALTPAMLRPGLLTGRPLVMLGACRAAQASPFRKEPWSLPNALVRAGARAVLASRADLPDAEIGDFFDGVRRRVESGARPAIALRDQRLAALGSGREWVRSVVLFE